MSWSGSGSFNRAYNWTNDAAAGIPITASRMDAEDDNFATGINACLAKNGENAATNNLNIGGHRLTFVGAGSAATDASTIGGTETLTNKTLASPVINGPITGNYTLPTFIPPGTVMLFMQAAAPTGWTQVNTHSNKALRIVAGTGAGSGGSVAFATVFGASKNTGSTTLTTNQIPLHTHAFSATTSSNGSHAHTAPGGVPFVGANGSGSDAGNFAVGVNNDYFNQTDAAGIHNHSVSGTTDGNSTTGLGHTHTLNLDLQYVDIIACSKN